MKKEKNGAEYKKTKNTLFLTAAFLFAGMIGSLFFVSTGQKGTEVLVTVDGQEYYRGSLFVEKEIRIGNGNTLVIKDGKADMSKADCPDQICVKQEPVSTVGDAIICLPNRVVITITPFGSETVEKGVDVIVR